MWLIQSTDPYKNGASVRSKSSDFKWCAISKIDVFAKQDIFLLGNASFAGLSYMAVKHFHEQQ